MNPHPLQEHWTNGGTGVTNFTEDRRAVYVEAVRRHGDPDLWVAPHAFGSGNEGYGGSLHCKVNKPLSDYWRTHEQVAKEMGMEYA